MILFWWGLLGGIVGSTFVLGFYIYSQIPDIQLRLLLVKNVRDHSYIRITYETLDELTEFYIIEKNSRNLKNRFYERKPQHDFQEISMRGGDVRFDKFVADCKGLNIYSEVKILHNFIL